MYRKTFEVLAKYISSEYSIKVVFDQPDGQAHALLKQNELHLPFNIGNTNALSALALLMHEAAHIAYSKDIPMEQLVKDQEDHMVLNAIEDIRIDFKNFGTLPNVREFYKELVKNHVDLTKSQAPENVTALCGAILHQEGFKPKANPKVQAMMEGDGLNDALNYGQWAIEYKNWKDVRKFMDDIRKILGMKNTSTPLTQQQKIAIFGQGSKGDEKGTKQGDGKEDGPTLTEQLDGLLRPSSGYGVGDGPMQGGSDSVVGEVALDEMTSMQFKELLNMKERKVVENGTMLDTDNLVSYYTGDIESLFKEEIIIKNKKSKIMFLIDASGSMSATLLCRKPRWKVVAKCVKKLISILKEVKDNDSIDISWEVCGFAYNFEEYGENGDEWEQTYRPHGGTNIENGVRGAFEKLVKDFHIDGKRILVVFSDGDVCPNEIDAIKQMIFKHGQDIRTLIVGVGTDLCGKMAKDITGDNVIISEEDANTVLFETVKSML